MTFNRKKLERIRQNSFENYKKEIKKPWDTMDEDVEKALEIITRHSAQSPNGISLFIEEAEFEGENVTVKFPKWQMEARRLYVEKYGESKGEVIFEKVLMKVFDLIRASQPTEH